MAAHHFCRTPVLTVIFLFGPRFIVPRREQNQRRFITLYSSPHPLGIVCVGSAKIGADVMEGNTLLDKKTDRFCRFFLQ